MYKLIILIIAAIILTTIVCHAVFADPGSQAGTPGLGPNKAGLGGRIEKQLNLTDSQKARLEPLLKSAREQFTAIRDDTSLSPDQKQAKLQLLRPQIQSQVNKILTPAQQKALVSIRAEMHHNHPDWDHNGPGQHSDWDHNGPPPH
jgi:Spy/CpxP family protein refolding chaperone